MPAGGDLHELPPLGFCLHWEHDRFMALLYLNWW